jgi:hypothetical protein
MKTLDHLIEEQLRLPPVLPDARKAFGTIPGVIGVGIGFRTRAGRFTDEITLRFHVRRKRPLCEIPRGGANPADVCRRSDGRYPAFFVAIHTVR